MELQLFSMKEINFDKRNVLETSTNGHKLLSGPLTSKSGTEKFSCLLLYIGQQGQDIYNTWILTNDQKTQHCFQTLTNYIKNSSA